MMGGGGGGGGGFCSLSVAVEGCGKFRVEGEGHSLVVFVGSAGILPT